MSILKRKMFLKNVEKVFDNMCIICYYIANNLIKILILMGEVEARLL